MDMKKIMPLFLIIMVVGIITLGVQPVVAHTTEIKFLNKDYSVKTDDYVLNKTAEKYNEYIIRAQLYENGEWQGYRFIYFELFDSNGTCLLSESGMLTHAFTNTGTYWQIWYYDWKKLQPGTYTVKASYAGYLWHPPTEKTIKLHVVT
jgi:hypothetical protein